MKNNLYLYITGSVLIIGGVMAYIRFVPPTFKIIQYSPSTHSGQYQFNGVVNSFGNSSGTQQGRFGWELDVKLQPDGSTKFDLLYNGKFVKNLAVK